MTLSRPFLDLKSLSACQFMFRDFRNILPNILADFLDMLNTGLAAFDEIIRAVLLVSGNEVRIVNAGKRDHLGHLFLNLGFKGWLKNGSSIHSLGQIHAANVPATNDKII